MKKALALMSVAVLLCGMGFAGDKNGRPNYRADASLKRRQARSMSPAAADAVVLGMKTPGTAKQKPANPALDQQLKKLEMQSTKMQSQTVRKAPTKAAPGLYAAPPAQNEKNQPINFQYVPPKGAAARGNNNGNNAYTRKLMKPAGTR